MSRAVPSSTVVTVAAAADVGRVTALAHDLAAHDLPLLVVTLDPAAQRAIEQSTVSLPGIDVIDGRAIDVAGVPLTQLALALSDLDDVMVPLGLSCALDRHDIALYVDPAVAVVGSPVALLDGIDDETVDPHVCIAARPPLEPTADGRRPDAVDLASLGEHLPAVARATRRARSVVDEWAALVVAAAERGERLPRAVAVSALQRRGSIRALAPPTVVDLWELASASEVHDDGRGSIIDLIDELPVALIDTAGHDPAHPHRLRGDVPQPARRSLADLPSVARAVERAAPDRDAPAPFATLPSGRPVDAVLRALYADAWRAARRTGDDPPPDPFLDEAAFLAWATGSDFPRPVDVSRYVRHVLFVRPDVAQAYPAVPGPSTDGLVEWVHAYGTRELGMAGDLLPSRAAPPPRVTIPHPGGRVTGVNLAGFLDTELGLGEVARRVGDALEAAGLRVNPVGVDRDGRVTGTADPSLPIDVVCVNPDSLASFTRASGTRLTTGRYTIGVWFWETETLPDAYRWAYELVDEVWAASDFVAHALRDAPVPVRRFPLPIIAPAADASIGRRELGLPDDAFVVVVSFDHRSVLGRKNPMGAIEAYRKAFGAGDGALLVVKSINGDRFPDDAAAVRWAARGRDDIVVRDEAMAASHHTALLRVADCVLSLHRSEGFGFNLADALALGVPTVATGWSGNTTFMDDADGLVPVTLVPIGPGHAPYPPEHRWAEPDLDAAARALRAIAADPPAARARATATGAALRDRFSPPVCGEAMRRLLTTPAPQPTTASTASTSTASTSPPPAPRRGWLRR